MEIELVLVYRVIHLFLMTGLHLALNILFIRLSVFYFLLGPEEEDVFLFGFLFSISTTKSLLKMIHFSFCFSFLFCPVSSGRVSLCGAAA